MLDHLQSQPADPLLALIGQFRADPRPFKIDLGVGVFRDEHGRTPVFSAVKRAEALLLEAQETKAYLGPEGDQRFVELLRPLVFGRALADEDRLVGVQTPGGTGALRLGAELIARANPEGVVWVGLPSWPNHDPILKAARLKVSTYTYFGAAAQSVRFVEMMDALSRAEAGDVVLLQGCCHNPTGADLTLEQWNTVADVVVSRGLVPFVDLAYQGLGRGLAEDALGPRLLLERVPEALVAVSASKNFGLYRERTGALFVLGRSAAQAQVAFTNMLSLARANYSMPPDHGAAVVRTILEAPALTEDWQAELASMRERIASVRGRLAATARQQGIELAVAEQQGMFSLLPLPAERIRELKEAAAVYMAGSGRINIAGLKDADIALFAQALAQAHASAEAV
jgi:aromatic-amino-acid transaminase